MLVVSALFLNHSADLPDLLRLPMLAGVIGGLFVLSGATPAALGLLADMSEAFPDDRGAIMGLYSVFLALGQIGGAFLGGVAAERWAFDGILFATLALLAVAVLPLSRLRRYEHRFTAQATGGPVADATAGAPLLAGEVVGPATLAGANEEPDDR